MVLRLVEHVLGLLLWCALAFVAGVVAIEVASATAGNPRGPLGPGQAADAVRAFDPGSTTALLVAGGLVLAGLVLLVLQFVPRRPGTLTHAGGRDELVLIDRRGLERRLAASAVTDEDVGDAQVHIRRKVRVDVLAKAGVATGAVRSRVAGRLRGELAGLVRGRPPRLRVRVQTGGGRVR